VETTLWVPTGMKDGAFSKTTGFGSTMSVAEAPFTNELTPATVSGTPVGVVA
jgi:hypothetical protein